LRDRIDAVIAHEYEESIAGTHEGDSPLAAARVINAFASATAEKRR